jgi:hypothetical protein
MGYEYSLQVMEIIKLPASRLIRNNFLKTRDVRGNPRYLARHGGTCSCI